MNIHKAGKQTKAFWRSEARFKALWEKEPTDYATLQSMLRGHAAGWTAGVAWERRNQKATWPKDASQEIDRLRGIIARNALQRLRGEDATEMYVTADDIKASLEMLYSWQSSKSPGEKGQR